MIENVVENLSMVDLLASMPPEVASLFKWVGPLVKTAGILFIIYIIVLIIQGILGIRRNIRIKKIYKKVNEIDKKMDKLLGGEKPRKKKAKKK